MGKKREKEQENRADKEKLRKQNSEKKVNVDKN